MSVHNYSEPHKGRIQGKFLGDTKGNADLEPDRSYEDKLGGSGEPHSAGPNTKWIGHTKGNYDLPPDRSSGVATGYGGGQHKAGGVKKKKGGMDYSKGMSY